MGEPRSWGEFTAELAKLIGQEADTGGSQTAGTVFAKENAILEMMKNGGMPVVRSVQRGTAHSGKFPFDISINEINPDKAVVLIQNAPTTSSNYARAVLYRLSNNKISVNLGTSSYSGYDLAFSWQVIEFY